MSRRFQHGGSRSAAVVATLSLPVALLLSGFIALLAFWDLGTYPASLPGLFHYHSATWGDGLLLPTLALSLTILIRRLPRPRRRWPTWAAAIGGAAAGALLVATWLADPHPSPNWTIPRPHYLTTAGWWHAAFLVGASGYLTGAFVELFRRLRAASLGEAKPVARSPLMALGLGCATGYAWLAAADSAHAGQTVSGKGSLAALILAAVIFLGCLYWSTHGAWRTVAATAIPGVLIAAAAVALATEFGHAPSFMLACALAGSLGAGVALSGAPGRRMRFAALEIVSVSAIFATSTLLAVRTSEWPPVFIAPLLAVVAAIIVRHIYSDATKRYRGWCSVNYLAGAGISAALLAAGIFGLWLSEHKVKAYVTGGFLLTILGAILGGTFLPYFKSDYEELMNLEGDAALRQADKRPGAEQYDVARDAWVRLVGYAVSSVASMLVLTVALGPSLGWVDGRQQLPWQLWAAMAAVGALTLPTWGAVVKARRRHPEHGPPAPPTGGSRYAWWSVLSSAAAILVGAAALDDSGVNGWAIAQSALLTAFAAQTMLGNGAWLHTKRLQPAAWCAAATSCLAVGVLVYCTLTVGIWPHGAAASVGFSFLAWLVTATVAASIVVTTTCAIYVADGKPYATDYPPADNCGQDSFLLLCMWFVLGWTPQIIFAHVPPGAPERLASIGTILAGFLLLFGPAFLWTLENNDTHVERQRRVRGVPADHGALSALNQAKSSVDRIRTLPARILELDRSIRDPQGSSDSDLNQHEFLVRLSGHTAIQNVVALMLAIITIIGIVGVSSGFTPSASGIAALPPVE